MRRGIASQAEVLGGSDDPLPEQVLPEPVDHHAGEEAGRARNRVNAALEGIYGYRVPAIEAASIAGTVADCVREVNQVVAAGAELILFTTLFDQREQMERLAGAVLPKLG